MVNVRPLDNIVSATARTESIIASVSASSESSYSSVGVIDVTYYYNLCKQYAEQSANSATSAGNSATSASGYATNASTSATNAYNYSINAYNSAELARQYSEMFSHVQISTTQPTDTSVDVWLDPNGEQGKLSQLTNDVGYITGITSTDVTTALGYTPYNSTNPNGYQNASQVTSAITSNIINDVTHTDINKSLSANMGKELQDQITNLKQRGRYLSIWNCVTGLATTEPTVNPYTYKAGDYFIIGVVGTTNYKPNGSTYDKTIASTTVETGDVQVNDTYYYDGTSWSLLHTQQPTVAFGTLAGSPYDNANLTTALNAKYDASNPNGYTSNIGTITGITMNGTSKGTSGVVDLGTVITAHQDISGKLDKNNAITGATKCKITYDSKGLITGGADLTASDIPNLTSAKITDLQEYTAQEVETLWGSL